MLIKNFITSMMLVLMVASSMVNAEEQVVHLVKDTKELPKFELVDHNGNPFTNESLTGKTTVMFFGYTSCPDICPTTLAILNIAHKQIQKSGANMSNMQFVFVSVDPDRDSLEKLKTYSQYFGGFVIGVTGKYNEFERLAIALDAHFEYNDPDEETGFYIVDHAAHFSVIGKEAKLIASIPQPHIPNGVAEAVIKLSK